MCRGAKAAGELHTARHRGKPCGIRSECTHTRTHTRSLTDNVTTKGDKLGGAQAPKSWERAAVEHKPQPEQESVMLESIIINSTIVGSFLPDQVLVIFTVPVAHLTKPRSSSPFFFVSYSCSDDCCSYMLYDLVA
eukprot:536167-Amphidinium_carterae.1